MGLKDLALWEAKFLIEYANQQPSQSNGDNSRLEGSEATGLKTPTNNIPHERPASHVDGDMVRFSLETMR